MWQWDTFLSEYLSFSVSIILRLLHTDHQPPTINHLPSTRYDLNYLQCCDIKHFKNYSCLSFIYRESIPFCMFRPRESVHTLQNNITQTYDRSVSYRTTLHKLTIDPCLTEQHYTKLRSVRALQNNITQN
jgi:hypothetical protein